MTNLRRIALLALAAAVALTTASCTLPPELATRDTTAVGLDTTPVPRDIPVGAADRDPLEVATSATAIDPCLLIDPAVAAARGVTDPVERGFGGCTNGDVTVDSYTPFGPDDRFTLERFELAGAVGYRDATSVEFCVLWVPISFDAAMQFSSFSAHGSDGACSGVEQYATAAITTLTADPTALNRADLRDAIDACGVMAQLPSLTGRYSFWRADWEGWSGSACRAVKQAAGVNPLVTIALSLIPTTASPSTDPELTIAGRAAHRHWWEGTCFIDIVLWLSTTDPSAGDVVARIMAPTCAEATTIATEMVVVVDAAAPLQPTGSPMFFAAGTTDSAAVGACVDVFHQQQRDCAPAVDAAVPSGPFKFITAAAADPNVLCAAAAPAVNEIFGADLRPTTVLTQVSPSLPSSLGCEFVRPDRTLVVSLQVDVTTIFLTLDALHITELPTSVADPVSALHPANAAAIGLGDEQPGTLGVAVVAYPNLSEGPDAVDTIDPTALDGFDELTERLAVDLLGGS